MRFPLQNRMHLVQLQNSFTGNEDLPHRSKSFSLQDCGCAPCALFSILMDALVEPKDYIAVISCYPCRGSGSLLFTSTFHGRWEAHREY